MILWPNRLAASQAQPNMEQRFRYLALVICVIPISLFCSCAPIVVPPNVSTTISQGKYSSSQQDNTPQLNEQEHDSGWVVNPDEPAHPQPYVSPGPGPEAIPASAGAPITPAHENFSVPALAPALPTAIEPDAGPSSQVKTITSDFNGEDLVNIIDASQNNRLKFNMRYKGYMFSVNGTFIAAPESRFLGYFSKGVYTFRVTAQGDEVDCDVSERETLKIAADWAPGRQQVTIFGPIYDTKMGVIDQIMGAFVDKRGVLVLDKGCNVIPK